MADKVIKAARKARLEMWQSFKTGISIPGYAYYQPPAEVTYRYPAPGSVPRSETDHYNMFKPDWKTPFRHSIYNITQVEQVWREDDPREVESFAASKPRYNTAGRRGVYDAAILHE